MRTFNFLRKKYPEQNVRNAGYCVSLLFIFELSQATCSKNDRSQYYRKAIMLKNAGSWKKKSFCCIFQPNPRIIREQILPAMENKRSGYYPIRRWQGGFDSALKFLAASPLCTLAHIMLGEWNSLIVPFVSYLCRFHFRLTVTRKYFRIVCCLTFSIVF